MLLPGQAGPPTRSPLLHGCRTTSLWCTVASQAPLQQGAPQSTANVAGRPINGRALEIVATMDDTRAGLPRAAPAARGVKIAPTTASVWTGDCSMAVELARMNGPVGGVIETPAQLVEHARGEASWDLALREVGLLPATVTSVQCRPIGRAVSKLPIVPELGAR